MANSKLMLKIVGIIKEAKDGKDEHEQADKIKNLLEEFIGYDIQEPIQALVNDYKCDLRSQLGIEKVSK